MNPGILFLTFSISSQILLDCFNNVKVTKLYFLMFLNVLTVKQHFKYFLVIFFIQTKQRSVWKASYTQLANTFCSFGSFVLVSDTSQASWVCSWNTCIKVIISYIKMKVCMYVCVCMSGGLPPDPHKPSPRNLAWAPHFTLARHRAKGKPQMLTPGVPPIVTPSEKLWRVKIWAGASKQKLLLGVGLPCKILFVGGSPKPGARRVIPYQMGVYALRIGRVPANKSCSSGWVWK